MIAVSRPEGVSAEPTFENALKGLRATGASVGTHELVELLAKHGSEEGKVLATYEELAGECTDESVQYLISLILDDERRHHRLLAEMANAMAWGGMTVGPDSMMPSIKGGMDPSLLAQTHELRRIEEADYRELKRLRRRLKPFADTTMWSLIVELMLLDTEKHMTILKFLEKHHGRR